MDYPVTNNTRMPIWVGGVMIPAGETKVLPAHQVPEHLRPAPAAAPAAPPADPLDELLAGKVAEIQAALAGLTDADLERLVDLETAQDKPRKGVLDAAAGERLRRAQHAEFLETLAQRAESAPDAAAIEALIEDQEDADPAAEALLRETLARRFPPTSPPPG